MDPIAGDIAEFWAAEGISFSILESAMNRPHRIAFYQSSDQAYRFNVTLREGRVTGRVRLAHRHRIPKGETMRTSNLAILSSSLNLFVHRGFSATRIQDIARDAGISQGLCYHYFPSKDDILVALLERALPRMDQAAKDLESASMPSGDKVRMALEALVGGLEKNDDTGRYHLLVAVASASDALPQAAREILDRHGRNPYAVMKRIFATGQKEGSVRDGDPRQMALVFWALIKGLSIHHAVHGSSLGRPDPKFLLPLFLREVPPCKA